MTDQDPSEEFSELRKRAEKAIEDQLAHIEYFSPEDTVKIIYELRVHQLELELQNEELRSIRRELEISHSKYVDLYEFSPVGLLTLDREGVIQEANLTFAGLMGINRNKIIKRHL